MFFSNFLTALARKYELSPEQEEVFLLWFLSEKTDPEISEELHVTVEAIRNRKTGIYRKFSIPGTGANKANKLRNWLEAEAKKQGVKADVQAVSDDLESLVKEVKHKIAADMTERCGTMRVLDMTQSIDLDRIYTDVNILEKVSSKERVKPNEVLPTCNREDVDRWMMGKIKGRIAGLEAVEAHKKLMVLGKPGSGKTTFLKYLAISCLNGKFHSELVPIFVTLRTYSEVKGSPSLEEYILDELQHRKVTQESVKLLLENGKALILLDGLDEVKDEHEDRVRQDIENFSIRWLNNRFAITCRIASREEVFERFTDIEVADFDDKQIEIFVNKWFLGKDKTNAKILLEKLNDNQPVKELAKTPLLLTLICFLFENCKDLPTKRSDIYKEGLEVLMRKWGANRKVERDWIYKNLSLQSRQDMLGQIAFRGFEYGEYFFQKEDLQRQIECICNLSNSDDSEVILKAIEHHHGLLVERARNIYSFSHLTFQEYFTVREIERERHFETLIQHITDPRWNEVFLLTAEMLRRVDEFLRLMKGRIEGMLARDKKLQAFLLWVTKKTNSVQTRCKAVAVRSYYAYIVFYTHSYDLNIARALALDLDDNLTCADSFVHEDDLVYAFTLELDLELDLKLELELEPELEFLLDLDLSFTLGHAHFLTVDHLALDHNFARALIRSLNRALTHASALDNALLPQELQLLKDKLPKDREKFSQWWKTNGEQWMRELFQVCIDRRNIGHDWQFTKEQFHLLEKYYEANHLLVQCMNRSYVSKQVRDEIEATLLLPVDKEKVERKEEKS